MVFAYIIENQKGGDPKQTERRRKSHEGDCLGSALASAGLGIL